MLNVTTHCLQAVVKYCTRVVRIVVKGAKNVKIVHLSSHNGKESAFNKALDGSTYPGFATKKF
jgi:hypothetical protein